MLSLHPFSSQTNRNKKILVAENLVQVFVNAQFAPRNYVNKMFQHNLLNSSFSFLLYLLLILKLYTYLFAIVTNSIPMSVLHAPPWSARRESAGERANNGTCEVTPRLPPRRPRPQKYTAFCARCYVIICRGIVLRGARVLYRWMYS